MTPAINKTLLSKTLLWIKIPALIILIGTIFTTIVVTGIVIVSGDSNYSGRLTDLQSSSPPSQTESKILEQVTSLIPQYKKSEEQTYLTLPEWYLVFNPNEYAHYLAQGNNPSNFPFLRSIDEYWRLYDRVIRLTEDQYPPNSEYKTMLLVIGVSTTLEYMIKGLYENTIGRFSYWTCSEPTPEDRLIQQAHLSYGSYIYQEPWYSFPFSDWLTKIWTETPFWGANFLRKIERKFMFTLEFGFKTIYAKIIGYGAKTAYDPSDGQVKMHISSGNMQMHDFKNIDERIKVLHGFDNGEWIISIPRWGEFTEIVPKLISKDIQLYEIAGNDDILVTAISDKNKTLEDSNAQLLFTSLVISPKNKHRLVFSTKVANLANLINSFKNHNITLEHIYDY